MIIANTSAGPRLCTDHIAHDVRSFVGGSKHSHVVSAGARVARADTTMPKAIDELYPALFAGETQPRPSLLARLVASFKAAVVAIRHAQSAR